MLHWMSIAFSLTFSCDLATLVSLSLRSRFDAALAPYPLYQPSESLSPCTISVLTFPIFAVERACFGLAWMQGEEAPSLLQVKWKSRRRDYL